MRRASRDFAERAETMFGGYKGIWAKVATELKGVKGYPVKSMFALGVGGPQCRTAPAATPPPESGTAAAGRAIGSAIGGLFGKKKPDQTTGASGCAAADRRRPHTADDRQLRTSVLRRWVP
jgi:hypothetical protein